MSKTPVQLDSLAVIPAKGYSERIPRKNMALLAGKPLVQYTIEAALESRAFDRIMVSTEDPQIGAFAQKLGAEVPFLRDARLAADGVNMTPVLMDAARWYQKHRRLTFDKLCMLPPSSPLRTAVDIVAAKRILTTHPEADSVISVTRCDYPPGWAMQIEQDGTIKPSWPEHFAKSREELPDWHIGNGAVFWARMSSFMRGGGHDSGVQLPYIMPADRGLDVDYPEELAYAEFLLQRRQSGAREF
ncbi:MAG: acylneuraminate cytidylyltransferase family protein [Phycisphaerae bacterium]|nr:acylneuraminate cytidylyltransferase family protein [Phycisphaerae bacterium]